MNSHTFTLILLSVLCLVYFKLQIDRIVKYVYVLSLRIVAAFSIITNMVTVLSTVLTNDIKIQIATDVMKIDSAYFCMVSAT